MTKSNTSRKTKSGAVRILLRRGHGATIDEIMQATGWKPHSCRAFLTGVRKSDGELTKQERSDGKTAYRIGSDAVASS
jgi:hypothetical protein